MDITPLVHESVKVVQGYGPGFFRINGVIYRQSVLVTADKVVEISVDNAEDGLQIREMEEFLGLVGKLELLLIGTGSYFSPLKEEDRLRLKGKNLSVDLMDSGAACRTYNVLVAEQRRAGAVLIPA